jgi:thiol-disulfide isomerase/thioredoxin
VQFLIMPIVHEAIHAPEFAPGEWLNAPPLSLAYLRGGVVLVDFWDYSCVNCLRTLPYLQAWWERYRALGFTLIGVHTPEFSFARQTSNVQAAVERLGITYPVLLDHEHRTWQAWANRYWPAKYLLDTRGVIRYFHFGEGNYTEIETAIQHLLRDIAPDAVLPPPLALLRPSDAPDTVCYHATPELYLGYQRGRLANPEPINPNTVTQYRGHPVEVFDQAYLEGAWHCGAEGVTVAGDAAAITVRYHAKEVNLVAMPPTGVIGLLAIEQDGHPLTRESCGADAQIMGKEAVVHLDTPRMYQLVVNPSYGTHELRLQFNTPGVSAYVLTFITDCLAQQQTEEQAA